MTRTAAPVAESVEWAGLAAMAKLLVNSTKSRLTAVPNMTFKTGDRNNTRHILGQGNLDDAITIKNARESLMTASGDRVDLTKGREEAFSNIVRNPSRGSRADG